ncbi:hypothetical protein PHPALM_28008 [Phytophthora palmivora]|uniref:PiggyBac transposable element-derived protein domain-containing protein n=1 Tax=Phytophthora palmivora TaxID=4796 RepID=A0A2P4XB60_9STRA|nr:hypothetical protein PHPALM_28008 [Phytophthora palmivora]
MVILYGIRLSVPEIWIQISRKQTKAAMPRTTPKMTTSWGETQNRQGLTKNRRKTRILTTSLQKVGQLRVSSVYIALEDVNQDVNHIAATDDPNKFVGFVSNAENDDGDDEDLSMDTIDGRMVQLPIPPEMRFDDRLLLTLRRAYAQLAASIRSYCSTKWRNAARRHGSILFVGALSMQLLRMGFYSVGTGDKKKPPKIPKNRSANIERGTFIVAEALHTPTMQILRWWDTRAVHILSTGGSVQYDRIVRRDTLTGEQQELACPSIVKDYQTWGRRRARPATSSTVLCTNESFQATPSKEQNTGRSRRANHKPLLNDEWRPANNNQGRKRRTSACKVCSLLKDTSNARGGDSSTYCRTCKLQTSSKKPMAGRVFLCEKKRHTVKGALRSCFDIWHECWSNGTLAPAPQHRGKRSIRARTPVFRNEREGGQSGEEASDESTRDSRSQKQARLFTGTIVNC